MHKHPDNATLEDKALEYLKRVARPAYLGYIAIEIGQSLKRTTKVVDGLEEAGSVRYLTLVEKRALGADASSVLCALVDS